MADRGSERDGVQIYNNNTLNLRTWELSEEQIRSAIKRTLDEIKTKCNGITSSFFLNYVRRYNRETKTLEPTGVCFVFIKNPQVYHIILGRNPDGTDRVEFTPDPDWVEPEEEEAPAFTAGMGWGDMMSELDEIEKRKEPPMIRVQLPPLVGPITAITTDGVAAALGVQASFERITKEKQELYDLTTLYSSVKTTISDERLAKLLRFFSHSPNFPKISSGKPRNGVRNVYIKFNPTSHDAMFCLQLIKTIQLKGKDGEYYLTRFDYSRKRE